MEEKLFVAGQNFNLRDVITKISQLVTEKEVELQENEIDNCNEIPKLLLLKGKNIDRALSFVEYIDSLLISKEEKVRYIITLVSIIVYGKINLEVYDDPKLFTIVNYYQGRDKEEIKNTIAVISIHEILDIVRTKTLDINDRNSILEYIKNQAIKAKLDPTNVNKKTAFINSAITHIKDKDYYDLMDTIK